jgi:hypothetical protein
MLFEEQDEENDDFLEDTSEIKRDKIFQNLYEETELDTSEISFKVDSSYESKTYEYTLDEKIILEKVEVVIENSEKYQKFAAADEEGNYKKLNKTEINEVYQYVTSSLHKDPKIEIFSVLCSIFDISNDKFYESLSNTFKSDLISELKERGFLSNRNSLF